MKDRKVEILHLKAGMVLSRPVYDEKGRLLLSANVMLTNKTILQLNLNHIDEVYIKRTLEEEVESKRIERIRQTKEFKTFNTAHEQSVKGVRDTLNKMLASNAQINVSVLLSNVNHILEMNKNTIQVFDMLHCIREYDDSTYVHCVNVALICNAMGKWLGYSKEDIEALTLSGLLHDAGKLMMPKQIITKPDRLTLAEYAVIKSHPEVGYRILEGEKLDPRIKWVAFQHHEKCDGSGYPQGKKGNEISEFSKIVTIADVYDAMTANRVYRLGVCPFHVIELFEQEGLQKYEIAYLLVFMEHIVEAYINKEVLLNNGCEAKIIMINKHHLSRPVVGYGSKFIDLSKNPHLEIQSVL